MNGLAICSGVGGLELGMRLAIPGYRTVCHVEREAFAAATLVARMEDQALDPAPVWDDLTTFDGRPWRGVVDLVSAGFPCQPVSLAGKGLAQKDERWLWPHVARVVREVGPRYVFLENVPGLVQRGLSDVLGSLAELGFDAEWGVFSAAGSGAPHIRKRVFILAHSQRPELRLEPGWGCGQDGCCAAQPRVDGQEWDAADPSGEGLPQWQGQEGQRAHAPASRSLWWTTEPDVGRVAHGTPHRVDRLRSLGNGVVPAVAARAWRTLASRIATHDQARATPSPAL